METIEVVYSDSMKINKGNFEQQSPFYSAKSIFSVPDGVDVEDACNKRYEALKAIVEPMLRADYDKNRTDLANIRFREKDGKKYPSVTSILCPDGIYKGIKNLAQFTERGNIADAIFKEFMIDGKSTTVPDMAKIAPLTWDFDILKFIKDNKLVTKADIAAKTWSRDVEVFNEEYQYSGEIDLMKGNTLILDVKSGQWKWEQQIMYAKCKPEVERVAIADLKENKYIELPITDPIIQKAWEKGIYKRGEFHARFGI